jgi:hypothetical protein
MRRMLIAAAAVGLAACGSEDPGGTNAAAQGEPAAEVASAGTATPARPDLAGCPARRLLEEGLRERTAPIPVPAELASVMESGMDNFAVLTLDGSTLCIDASWMEEIHAPRLSPDRRFVSFDWGGYEAYGHVIVDRTGTGRELDTGVAPVYSPSGRRFAAADLGEAGYGALNAFAVWQVERASIRQLAKHEEIPDATDWTIERWVGERCLELSAIPWDGYTGQADAPRDPYRAREAGGWRIEPGRCTDE